MRPEYLELHKAHREHLGVHWLMEDHSHYGQPFFFQSFQRGHGAPKGNGAKALREVLALADMLGHEITLCTYGARLIQYYQQFGFVQMPHINYAVFMKRPVPADCFRRRPPDPAIAEQIGWQAAYISSCQARLDGASSVAYASN